MAAMTQSVSAQMVVMDSQFASNSSESVDPLSVTNARDQEDASPSSHATPNVADRNLMQTALNSAQARPNETAFSWLNDDCTIATSFTNAELWHFSGQIGQKLVEVYKLKRGDRVLIVYPFGLDFIIAFLACLRVGVVVVSVYPPNPSRLKSDLQKFSHFVADSQSSIALTTCKYASMVRFTGLLHKWPKTLKWVSTDDYPRKCPASAQASAYDITPDDDDLAFVQYTSGSTGNSKGGATTCDVSSSTHCKQSWNVKVLGSPWQSADTLGRMGQYHDMGLFNILTALYTKTPAFMMSPIQFIQNPVLWPQAIEKFKATWICGPNFAYGLTCKRLQESGKRFDCSSVVFAGLGAEPTQPATLQSAVDVLGIARPALANMYGLAETCVFATASLGGPVLDETRVSVGSVAWSAARGIEVVIALEDEGGQLYAAEDGHVGEVCLRSASVAAGYWGKDELTQRTFHVSIEGAHGRFLRTGDLGYVNDDDLFLCSRLKDLIIVNGRNVWPSDLETCAEDAFPHDVRPGCSAAFQGSEQGAVLVCELRDGRAGGGAGGLAQSIRSAVETECGVAVEEVLLVAKGAVPKTTSGKVQRSATAQLLKDGQLQAVAALRKDDDLRLDTATSLRELLELCGVEDFSVSVVQNGLTSLQVMQVVNAAETVLRLTVDYQELSDVPAGELCDMHDGRAPVHPPLQVSASPPSLPSPPSCWWRVLLQSLILAGQLLVVLAAAVPAVVLVDSYFEADDRGWMHHGRVGPWIALAVVSWMATYTLLCVALKWLVLGSMRPDYVPLWSFKFARWMLVERLWTVWEYLVGRFLLETPWLCAVYVLLGARVAWTARINAYFRCWDLVTIGPRACVSGLLYPRVFDRHGVRFGQIHVGAGSAIRSQSVVQAPAELLERVEVEAAAVVPPHSTLGPAGSVWHGNLCRPRKSELHQPAGAFDDQAFSSEPWLLTRAALPFVFCAANVAAFIVSSSVVGAVHPWSAPWSTDTWVLALSYVAVFLLTGLQLLALVLLLKWTFLSPFLTDALAGLAVSTYLPWLERSPVLVNAWQRLLGMQLGSGACVLYTWACAPSAAHLCSVGRNSLVFSTVLAPREPATLWSFLSGKTEAPWTEERDIVIGDNVGLYAQGRVEHGTKIGPKSHLAGFSMIEAGMDVEGGALMAGNPPIRLETSAPSEGGGFDGVKLWQQTSSLLMLVAHRSFVTTVVALGIHFEKCLPGAGDFGNSTVGVHCAVLLRIAVLLVWIIIGELGEMLLYKWLVLGRAERKDVTFQSWRALLFMHGSMMWDQSLPLCSAFLSGGFGMNCVLWLLGFKIDVGSVLCTNLPCVPAQDAELISIEGDAIIDDCAYVSSHNVTTAGISLAPSRVGAGAVLHPLSGLFGSTLGSDASLYPRAKTLREVNIAEGETWVGAPAYRATCQWLQVDGVGEPEGGTSTDSETSREMFGARDLP